LRHQFWNRFAIQRPEKDGMARVTEASSYITAHPSAPGMLTDYLD